MDRPFFLFIKSQTNIWKEEILKIIFWSKINKHLKSKMGKDNPFKWKLIPYNYISMYRTQYFHQPVNLYLMLQEALPPKLIY